MTPNIIHPRKIVLGSSCSIGEGGRERDIFGVNIRELKRKVHVSDKFRNALELTPYLDRLVIGEVLWTVHGEGDGFFRIM
jgi:hypothetical protein